VEQLRIHEIQVETQTAPQGLNDFYQTVMSGNTDELAKLNKSYVQRHFVSKILFEYLIETKKLNARKVGFDYDDSNVLIWVEIDDDDEKLERELILAEARINARYHQYGFDIKTTLVEERDGLDIPNHYKPFKQGMKQK